MIPANSYLYLNRHRKLRSRPRVLFAHVQRQVISYFGFYAIKSVGYHLFGCPENVPWAKLRVVADVCKPINLEDREAWGLQTQAWATQ